MIAEPVKSRDEANNSALDAEIAHRQKQRDRAYEHPVAVAIVAEVVNDDWRDEKAYNSLDHLHAGIRARVDRDLELFAQSSLSFRTLPRGRPGRGNGIPRGLAAKIFVAQIVGQNGSHAAPPTFSKGLFLSARDACTFSKSRERLSAV